MRNFKDGDICPPKWCPLDTKARIATGCCHGCQHLIEKPRGTRFACKLAKEVTMEMYKIVRYYRRQKPSRVIKRGLSLEDAKMHCQSQDTQKIDKAGNVVWFDGFTKE